MIKDLTDRVNAVLEKIDALSAKVEQISEDVEDICAELLSEEPVEDSMELPVHGGRIPPQLDDFDKIDLNSLNKQR